MPKHNGRELDAQLSPRDDRDWQGIVCFAPLHETGAVPEAWSYRKYCLPVRNQGVEGSCFPHAVTGLREIQEKIDVGLAEYLSPQWIYNRRPDLKAQGMNGRDVMKILQDVGCVMEDEYCYGTRDLKPLKNPKLLDQASRFRIAHYALVMGAREVRAAIWSTGPVALVVPVYSRAPEWSFWQDLGELKGYHAVCAVAYDTEGLLIRNSWGTEYSAHGYTKMLWADWRFVAECWSTTDAPTPDAVQPPVPRNGWWRQTKERIKQWTGLR